MPRSCALIARALEKHFDVDIDPFLPGDDDPDYADVDCVINVRPPKWRRGYGEKFASLYFVDGKLNDGDVQVSEAQLPAVLQVLKTTANSCKLKEVHEHDEGHGGPYFPSAASRHVHISGCAIPDLRKVLEAGGYRG